MRFDNDNILHICKEEILSAFSKALTTLFENDELLFEFGVDERTIAGRLAMYLRDEFAYAEAHGITIDIEYNRDADKVKYEHQQEKKNRIFPDIILHQRGSGKNQEYKNDIFYCEMKKSSTPNASDKDKVKIQLKKRKYQYGINLYYINHWEAKLDLYLYSENKIICLPYCYSKSYNYLLSKEDK